MVNYGAIEPQRLQQHDYEQVAFKCFRLSVRRCGKVSTIKARDIIMYFLVQYPSASIAEAQSMNV